MHGVGVVVELDLILGLGDMLVCGVAKDGTGPFGLHIEQFVSAQMLRRRIQ